MTTPTPTKTKSTSTKSKSDEPLLCGFTIRIDQREQAPFNFTGINGRSDQKYRPIIVPVEFGFLATGDYSIKGFENCVSVERKNLSDFYGTILGQRDRFERELARLSEMEVARVICEGCWNAGPPRRPNESDNEYNERAPKHFRSVLGSVRSWMLEFPKVHWVQCANRRQAELECFRTLEMWWRKRETQI